MPAYNVCLVLLILGQLSHLSLAGQTGGQTQPFAEKPPFLKLFTHDNGAVALDSEPAYDRCTLCEFDEESQCCDANTTSESCTGFVNPAIKDLKAHDCVW